MNKTVYQWWKSFKQGHLVVNALDLPELPSTSTVNDLNQVKLVILENRWFIIKEGTNYTVLSSDSCEIFSDVLCMKRIATKFLPNFSEIWTKKNVT